MAEATAAVATKVFVRRTDGSNINPATEEKQDQLLIALGALPVQTSTSIWERQSASTVAANILTPVLTYTVTGPVGSVLFLDGIRCTGTGAAEFRIEFNGIHKETVRLEVTDPSPMVPLFNYRTIPGDLITVSVIHTSTGTHNYEATLHAHR